MKTAVLFSMLFFSPLYAASNGDRNLDDNVIFPPACLIQNGGRVYDVTQPPEGHPAAKGDGRTDDTRALQEAMEYAVQEYVKVGWRKQNVIQIYLPNGQYVVSDMVCYSDAQAHWSDGRRKGWEPCNIRIMGQSRVGVEIRLKDKAKGFADPSSPRPILAFNHPEADFNNGVAFNALRNVKVNAGRGNPGAIGVQFIGANSATVANVTITAEDRGGVCALYMPLGSVHAYHHDITIEKYRLGISIEFDHDVYNAFEYLTLKNQGECAIRQEGGGLYLRRMLCDQTESGSAAVRLLTDGPQLGVYDSLLCGKGKAAVMQSKAEDQMTLLRKCRIEGYRLAVDHPEKEKDCRAGDISLYVSEKIISFRGGKGNFHDELPVAELPHITWEADAAEWAIVEAGNSEDHTKAVQKALDSGKACIFFPEQYYRITAPLKVPASVRQLRFMRAKLSYKAEMEINEGSREPLLIDGLSGAQFHVYRNSSRPIVLSECSLDINTSTEINTPQDLHVINCTGIGAEDGFCGPNQSVWARGINNEEAPKNEPHDFFCNGGKLWIFGYKTEGKPVTVLEVSNGGTAEVLGGVSLAMPDGRKHSFGETPMFVITDSKATITMLTGYVGSINKAIFERQGGEFKVFNDKQFPAHYGQVRSSGKRPNVLNNYFIPLYISGQ